MASPHDFIAAIRRELNRLDAHSLSATLLAHQYKIMNLVENPPLSEISEVEVIENLEEIEWTISKVDSSAADYANEVSLLPGFGDRDVQAHRYSAILLTQNLFRLKQRTANLLNVLGVTDHTGLLVPETEWLHYRPQSQPPASTIEDEFADALDELSIGFPENMARHVPLVLYIKHGDHLAARQAMRDLAEEYGSTEEFPPLEGSFFQRFRLWTQRRGAQELGDAMRRVAELPLEEQQANVNSLNAEAVSKLITALDNTETAAGLVGSILVIKVNGAMNFRTLTNREIIYLGQHPGLIRDPASMQVALDALAIEANDPVESRWLQD
ncbi:hypothetical protein HII36_05400 [Nonomuraea sp. NN258]|uniref:hypothetical protein n=1 Tax=Nonomuraea antri TaxID=2730852 RepID=UPI0015680563|nr:hypothetical protein [Nonomuraea antri]NRQ31273.1 hypothetical protein [Nonomuraea antri]